MVDKVPGDITAGNASIGSKVHATQEDNSLSRSHLEEDISRLQTALREYDAAREYKQDDFVMYNGVISQANQDISTPEAFDNTKWDPIAPVPTSSSLIVYPTVTIASTTTVNVTAMMGVVVNDYSSTNHVTYTIVRATPGTITINNVTGSTYTYLLLNIAGTTLQRKDAQPTSNQLRSGFQYGFVLHTGNVIETATLQPRIIATNSGILIEELLRAMTGNAGGINMGVSIQGNAVSPFEFDILGGNYFALGKNFVNTQISPNKTALASESPVSTGRGVFRTVDSPFVEITPPGPITILQGIYDNGLAVQGDTVPSGTFSNNEWTYHQVYLSTNTNELVFFWGQEIFSTEAGAKTHYYQTPFPLPLPTSGLVSIGAWVVKGDYASLISSDAEFIFPSGIGAGSANIVVEDGFGSTSAVVASSINNATDLNNRLLYDQGIAASDEYTPLSAGLLSTFRVSRDFTLTEAKASVTTAPVGAALLTVDIRKNGVTIFSTLITFDAGETTSTTASIPAVILDNDFVEDDEITVYVTQLDTDNVATGLKVYLVGIPL